MKWKVNKYLFFSFLNYTTSRTQSQASQHWLMLLLLWMLWAARSRSKKVNAMREWISRNKWNENVFELLITCWFIALLRLKMFIFLFCSAPQFLPMLPRLKMLYICEFEKGKEASSDKNTEKLCFISCAGYKKREKWQQFTVLYRWKKTAVSSYETCDKKKGSRLFQTYFVACRRVFQAMEIPLHGKNEKNYPVQVSMNFSTKLFHAWSEMKNREKSGSCPRIIFVIRTCNPRVKMKSRRFIIQCRHEIGRVCGNINDFSSQKPPSPTMMSRMWRTRLRWKEKLTSVDRKMTTEIVCLSETGRKRKKKFKFV